MDDYNLDLIAQLGGSEQEAPEPIAPIESPVITAKRASIAKELAASRTADTGGKQSTGMTTSIESRALSLLGSGVAPEQVASALGVTAGRISQLLAEESFAGKVVDLRYKLLQSHSVRDNKYDEIEDKLIDKLVEALPMIHKPAEILGSIKVINAAKRRGQSGANSSAPTSNIISLVLPTAILSNYIKSVDGQILRAGDQDLSTLPSSKLLELAAELGVEAEDAVLVQAPTSGQEIAHVREKEG